jgi:hypothetical protein
MAQQPMPPFLFWQLFAGGIFAFGSARIFHGINTPCNILGVQHTITCKINLRNDDESISTSQLAAKQPIYICI